MHLKGMKAYIWGTGKKSKNVMGSLDFSKVELMGFIDNDPSKRKFKCFGKPILPLQRISDSDYIIVSIIDYAPVLYQLEEAGHSREKIICYFNQEDFEHHGNDGYINYERWKLDILEERIDHIEHIAKIRIRNACYEYAEKKLPDLWFPKFAPNEEAVDKIINEGASLIRFGDGEFGLIFGRSEPVFQNANGNLPTRLRIVLETKEKNLLIAIAKNYGDLSAYTETVADGIRNYMTESVRELHYSILDKNRIYYDAYMFKCYMPYIDKENTGKRVELMKSIWKGRHLAVIEGGYTRTGVGNDLLDGALSIVRILCPTKNAFDLYGRILAEAMRLPKDRLILMAIGPAGKVMALDLYRAGHQVVDIGQADMDYDWFIKGKGVKLPNPYKYVSQLPETDIDDIYDVKYNRQIIARIQA